MRTINKILTKSTGAGRANVGNPPSTHVKIYDCLVPMLGAYDKGGAYWGFPLKGINPLRVRYTKDLSYIKFYRNKEQLKTHLDKVNID